jgi:site-specific recombinase XerD
MTAALRISEALKQNRADVDLQAEVLDIHDAKCQQRRFVPMHLSVPRTCKRIPSNGNGQSLARATVDSF